MGGVTILQSKQPDNNVNVRYRRPFGPRRSAKIRVLMSDEGTLNARCHRQVVPTGPPALSSASAGTCAVYNVMIVWSSIPR